MSILRFILIDNIDDAINVENVLKLLKICLRNIIFGAKLLEINAKSNLY